MIHEKQHLGKKMLECLRIDRFDDSHDKEEELKLQIEDIIQCHKVEEGSFLIVKSTAM